jgi:hypothetical protein
VRACQGLEALLEAIDEKVLFFFGSNIKIAVFNILNFCCFNLYKDLTKK